MLTCGLAADATVLVCAASVQEHLIHRVTLAADYLGLPKIAATGLAAAVIVGAFTGSFRRFERIAVAFCAGSLLLIPLYFLSHPAVAQMAHDFVVRSVMLLIIGIVGTTVALRQLFFQQSCVIDERITPRFIAASGPTCGSAAPSWWPAPPP
jgi:Mn2+/Fe2+ NRAMP family transporter